MSEYVRLKDYSDGVNVILDGRDANVSDFIANFNVMDARNVLSLYMVSRKPIIYVPNNYT